VILTCNFKVVINKQSVAIQRGGAGNFTRMMVYRFDNTGIITMRPAFLLTVAFFFLFGLPSPGAAQTAASNAVPVAVMTFLGDDLAQSALLHDAVVAGIEGMNGFTPQTVSAGDFPETLSLLPNEPPSPNILGDSAYVLTGEYYADMTGEWHFQLWLWMSAEGTLVSTDELTAQDVDEAITYMPALISWVFSLIPGETVTVAEEPPPAGEGASPPEEETEAPAEDAAPVYAGKGIASAGRRAVRVKKPVPKAGAEENQADYLNRWLYLGVRAGGAFNFYLLDGFKDYEVNAGQSLGYEISLVLGFRFLPFMGLQAEAVFSPDNASFRAPAAQPPAGDRIFYTEIYQSRSLMFPVVLKFPIQVNHLLLSPYAGAFVEVPLGNMEKTTAPNGTKGSFSFKQSLPLGVTGGLELGFALGPGLLFVDLRYGLNLDKTRVSDDRGIAFTRHRITFSLGYQAALFKRR
jgi:hypothetical protein